MRRLLESPFEDLVSAETLDSSALFEAGLEEDLEPGLASALTGAFTSTFGVGLGAGLAAETGADFGFSALGAGLAGAAGFAGAAGLAGAALLFGFSFEVFGSSFGTLLFAALALDSATVFFGDGLDDEME